MRRCGNDQLVLVRGTLAFPRGVARSAPSSSGARSRASGRAVSLLPADPIRTRSRARRSRSRPPSWAVCGRAGAGCTTHHAPRTTHHAPRTTHHAPRTTHHAPRTRQNAIRSMPIGTFHTWGEPSGNIDRCQADHGTRRSLLRTSTQIRCRVWAYVDPCVAACPLCQDLVRQDLN
jgi:hypothetical protein